MEKYQTMKAKIMELTGAYDEKLILAGAGTANPNIMFASPEPGEGWDEEYGDYVWDTIEVS